MLGKLATVCLFATTLIGSCIITANAETGRFFGHRRNIRRITFFEPTVSAQAKRLATAAAGSSLKLSGDCFGSESGSAFLVFDKVTLPVPIDDWQETTVTVTLPPLFLRDASGVHIDVVTPQGNLAKRKSLLMTPPTEITNGERIADSSTDGKDQDRRATNHSFDAPFTHDTSLGQSFRSQD